MQGDETPKQKAKRVVLEELVVEIQTKEYIEKLNIAKAIDGVFGTGKLDKYREFIFL